MLILLMAQHLWLPITFATDVLWSYSISNLAGMFVGLFLSKLPFRKILSVDLFSDIKEAWIGGRWALGGVTVSWLQGQAYMYVTAFFIGPEGVGFANAAKIFITPAQVLMPAITQVFMPRLAVLRVSDPKRMVYLNRIFLFGMVTFSLFYSASLYAFFDLIVSYVVGPRYKGVGVFVAAWCFALTCQFLNAGSGVFLQANKEFKILTLANTVSFLVSILFAVLFMLVFGAQGAILGTASGDLVMGGLLYWIIRKRVLPRIFNS
jgi:O-antigen/teichoic acid export membrane protein